MEKRTILITGVGGNVGQGIIRNIRKYFDNIRIVGCNSIFFSAGNHLCDIFYQVPYAYEQSYISFIKQIVENHRIELIIPSTDYEVFHLSQASSTIGTKIAVSDLNAASIYLDKYLSFLHHKKHGLPFAESFLPSQYSGQFDQIIVKPRKGRGSRGLYINPEVWTNFSDEDYIIQEFHQGQELTTAFYVNRENELHGYITLLRNLENGATNQCKVIRDYDHRLKPILELMVRSNEFRGSINLQSIVKDDGTIVPFEVNCRISGTNSIRSNFGFEDVRYTLQEHLFGLKPDKPKIIQGVAVRIMMDVIYPEVTEYDQCVNNAVPHYIF